MDEDRGHEAELGSAQETNMVDGNAFAREFREMASHLRPREREAGEGADVSDYVRGASEAFAFVAMRLAGEDPGPYDRWLDDLREQAASTPRGSG
jgi:hypothetical protein